VHFPHVACDEYRRTAIAIALVNGVVQYIPLSYDGFNVERMPAAEFAKLFPNVLADYPVERAAALFVQYAHSVGASPEALDFLGTHVKLTLKDKEMASKKPAAKAAEKKVVAKKATAAKKTNGAANGEAKVPRESAAAMFKELIMKGTMTDDKIFEKVQAKFGLDDKKRSYVAWYRNDLIKKGEANVPAAK
jgi:hypothetical protein